jgi:hypothetical protein
MKLFWIIENLDHQEEESLYNQGFSSGLVIDHNYDYAFAAIVSYTPEQEFLLRLKFGERLQLYSPQQNDSIV